MASEVKVVAYEKALYEALKPYLSMSGLKSNAKAAEIIDQKFKSLPLWIQEKKLDKVRQVAMMLFRSNVFQSTEKANAYFAPKNPNFPVSLQGSISTMASKQPEPADLQCEKIVEVKKADGQEEWTKPVNELVPTQTLRPEILASSSTNAAAGTCHGANTERIGNNV